MKHFAKRVDQLWDKTARRDEETNANYFQKEKKKHCCVKK